MTNIEKETGKILRVRISYYYSDSDSDDDYSCDGKIRPLLTSVPPLPLRHSDLITTEEEDAATTTIEEKITSKIGVPSGFGKVVGEYLDKLNSFYHDNRIDHNHLHELVKRFEKYLGWFPDDVPQKKIKKFCREAYAHTLWKTFLDEKISRRQFVSLMGRRPKFFPKEK